MCFCSNHQTVSNSEKVHRRNYKPSDSTHSGGRVWFKDVLIVSNVTSPMGFTFFLPGLLENPLTRHNLGTVQCTDVGYLSMKLCSYCKNKFKKIDLSWNALQKKTTGCFPARRDSLCYWEFLKKILLNHSLADLVPLQIMILVILVNLYQEIRSLDVRKDKNTSPFANTLTC